MRPFKYTNASSSAAAISLLLQNPSAQFLAGGTNLIDLMKEDVERPDELIDLTRLDLTTISPLSAGQGGVSIGALGKNTDAANHPIIREHFPLLSRAIFAGASAQIRNMATNGGNLLQRTRCPYFYDTAMPCNKRSPGSGCAAKDGFNRMHAILGWSEACVAVYPSDMAVALSALDASVKVIQADGKTRSISIHDFHRLPENHPEKDNTLKRGELISSITIPKNGFAGNSAYIKVRDRNSYAFALVSVGAGLAMDGNTITTAHIALGGVAHKPWRAWKAEALLKGKTATEANFRIAAEAEMEQARALSYNKFKIVLGKNTIINALKMAAEGAKRRG